MSTTTCRSMRRATSSSNGVTACHTCASSRRATRSRGGCAAEMRVTFHSGELTIEGDLALADGATRGAVVCHPHPQYGGDMNNNVVLAVSRALHDSGQATLRFNFRGV